MISRALARAISQPLEERLVEAFARTISVLFLAELLLLWLSVIRRLIFASFVSESSPKAVVDHE